MDELQDTGYPLAWFVDQNYVKNLYLCAICQDVLRDTVQIPGCGHQFCERCINDVLNRSNLQPLCPTCRKEISREILFNDNAARRTISNLPVKCPRSSCEWQGNLGQLIQTHHLFCDFRVVICDNKDCESRVRQRDMASHQIECEHRLVACQYCTQKYQFKDQAEHLKTCFCYPVECINKCSSTKIPRDEMEDHIGTHCPKTVIKCKYYQHGCIYKDERCKMGGHEKEEYEKHLELQGMVISRMEEKFKKDIKELTLRIDLMQNQANAEAMKHEEEIKKLRRELSCEVAQKETYVFKITEFNEKLIKAKEENRVGRIYGAPFITSTLGYTMKMSVYLNETREEHKDHLGVYIHLIKSGYDSMLSWPFQKTYTFTLIDQQESEKQRENIVKTVTPGGQDQFKKPTSEFNSGYGFPSFVPHATLNTRQYVKDDTVFITLHIKL